MKYLEKSLKNTCEGVFLENVEDSQPVDLLNNDLLNNFFEDFNKIIKRLIEPKTMVAISIVR